MNSGMTSFNRFTLAFTLALFSRPANLWLEIISRRMERKAKTYDEMVPCLLEGGHARGLHSVTSTYVSVSHAFWYRGPFTKSH
jgi:hypothetical protein